MISKKCNLGEFIEAVEDKAYHEFFILLLDERYASDDLLIHMRNDGVDVSSAEYQQISVYNTALHNVLYLLQVNQMPDLKSEYDKENYLKFRIVAEKLVAKGELLPTILKYFDD